MITLAIYALICAWALWCALSPMVKDGIVGKVFYAGISIAAFAAMVGDDASLQRANTTLLAGVALIGLRHFIMKMYKSYRAQRP